MSILYPEGKHPDVAAPSAAPQPYGVREAIVDLMRDGHPRTYAAVVAAVKKLTGVVDEAAILAEIGTLDTEWRAQEQSAKKPESGVLEGPGK